MDKIETCLKEYFEKERGSLAAGSGAARGRDYPEAGDFYLFLTDKLDGPALLKMLGHLKHHPEDQQYVSRARELMDNLKESEQELVSQEAINRAKALMAGGPDPACPHCGRSISVFRKSPVKQNLQNKCWLAAGAASFLLSFVFPGYFMQCLAIAFLAGVKWIVDERAAKTRIMIYKALTENSGDESKDLHRVSSHL